METITLKTTTKVEGERTISIPSFWKRTENVYIGIFAAGKALRITTPNEWMNPEISECNVNCWLDESTLEITKDEFMAKYNIVIDALKNLVV